MIIIIKIIIIIIININGHTIDRYASAGRTTDGPPEVDLCRKSAFHLAVTFDL